MINLVYTIFFLAILLLAMVIYLLNNELEQMRNIDPNSLEYQLSLKVFWVFTSIVVTVVSVLIFQLFL
ncbi:hypothetical protein [Aquimarina sp. 2201CG14-23]|uniref:hypothetical protein n=1 Tax=Aquimarina mycalae TaxID=3040073 RepID=UPI002477CD20|nr:hypothetical protein [Aquimarina sp. 2201CG14-23]